MTSEAKTVSNRENALRSTGPTTSRGRRHSSTNALQHGLSAKTIVIHGERVGDFEALHEALIESFAPLDAIEGELVLKMAIAAWRSRRVSRIESQLFKQMGGSEMATEADSKLAGTWRSISFDGEPLVNLMRYEVLAERAFYRALDALERHRAMRRLGQGSSAPRVVDAVDPDGEADRRH